MNPPCTFFVEGAECGKPAAYETYADHLLNCLEDDPDGDAICAEHAVDARRAFASKTTLVTCNRCGMPYYRVRSLCRDGRTE